MIAHIGGVPVEETLLPLLSGVSVLVLVRTWVATRFRRARAPRAS